MEEAEKIVEPRESEEEEKLLERRVSPEASTNHWETLNFISVLVAVVSVVTILAIGADECRRCFQQTAKVQGLKKFRAYGRNVDGGHLRHVFKVLERLGYEHDPFDDGWDLLWAHDYPFRELRDELLYIKSHQKINHFPGSGYLTNKVDLATSELPYIPPAFKLPEDRKKLLEFAAERPEKKYVSKNNNHRHVQVRELEEIDLDANGTFIQEFIDKPLLVNGYMFDIGIYAIITSVDPLRLYMYNGDVLLRFCAEKYHPIDPNNANKYVVGDDYLPIWEVPGLKYYYNELGLGMRDSLNEYLKSRGQDGSVLWRHVEEALRTIVLAKEPLIANSVSKYKHKENFFEMMRFDFIADENLNLYLLEANMSPNLSSAHFKQNQLLYEQVIYNLFGLVGVAERVQKESLAVRSENEETMQSADKNVMTSTVECAGVCRYDCDAEECRLCKPCMTDEVRKELLRAHREHLNRGDCKRVYPSVKANPTGLPENFTELSESNRLMYRWFQEKCLMDDTWC